MIGQQPLMSIYFSIVAFSKTKPDRMLTTGTSAGFWLTAQTRKLLMY